MIWIADAVGIWGLAWALDVSVSIPGAGMVSAVVGLGLMIPAGPGFIGTYEAFSVAALRLLGVEFTSAMALTLLMHAWSLTAAMILGAGGLGLCGINFAWLVHPGTRGVTRIVFIKNPKLRTLDEHSGSAGLAGSLRYNRNCSADYEWRRLNAISIPRPLPGEEPRNLCLLPFGTCVSDHLSGHSRSNRIIGYVSCDYRPCPY